MTYSQTIGRQGEDIACRFLERYGWNIVCRNYHSRWGEIDIIAEGDGELLLFIEVKTRADPFVPDSENAPRFAVTPQKQKKIRLTAQEYLAQYPELSAQMQPRFDVIEIYLGGNPASHIPKAPWVLFLPDAFQ